MRTEKELKTEAFNVIKEEIEKEITEKEKELESMWIEKYNRDMKNQLFYCVKENSGIKEFTQEELTSICNKELELKKELSRLKNKKEELETTIKEQWKL